MAWEVSHVKEGPLRGTLATVERGSQVRSGDRCRLDKSVERFQRRTDNAPCQPAEFAVDAIDPIQQPEAIISGTSNQFSLTRSTVSICGPGEANSCQ